MNVLCSDWSAPMGVPLIARGDGGKGSIDVQGVSKKKNTYK